VSVGSYHYLPEVRWVGKNFLVTGHAGIETYFAGSGTNFSGSFAMKNCSVL
jgi:hypothetical protein